MSDKETLNDIEIQKINKQLIKCLEDYRKVMHFMVGDAPIETLCLPKSTENILLSKGFVRIYDLFYTDLAKIKGIGKVRARQLTSRLNEFLAM